MHQSQRSNRLKYNLDFGIFWLIVAAFVSIAAQRLGTVPVPEGDEAFTLQVPYEMLYRGKLALPMLRYLGGNIENAWHSFIPVYFLTLAGFHKVFGFGLVQARAFNLATAVLTLLMVYLVGRRMFDWRAGLIAVVMLVGDQTFLERSRLLRDDYAAAALAMLAFYLYEIAATRRSSLFYVASGLAAGAGVMCHTNILYMIGAICLLILAREGRRALTSRNLYLFLSSAVVVMAYEIVYDIVDWKNFVLQNRGDEVHFRILEYRGWLQNLLEERLRYQRWYAGGVLFPGTPQVTLHIFQALTVAAIIYLIVVFVRKIRRTSLTVDSRMRLLIVTAVVVIFHALIVSHKRIYYIAHLAPWFALCVGVMLRDGLSWTSKLRNARWPQARSAYGAAVAVVVLAVAGYGFEFARQTKTYVANVRAPNLATFDEFATVLRSIVPDELCPVAVQNPSVWLVFPKKDQCFATIEPRMQDEVDLDGKDYVLIRRAKKDLDAPERREGRYHLLGEMKNTLYGNLLIYYTGNDPRFLDLEPKTYQFFD